MIDLVRILSSLLKEFTDHEITETKKSEPILVFVVLQHEINY